MAEKTNTVLPEPLLPPVTMAPDVAKQDFEAIMLAWDRACPEAKRRAFQLIFDNGSLTWWNEVPSHA